MPPCGALNAAFTLPNGTLMNTPKGDGYPRAKLDDVPGWRSLPEVVGGDAVPRIGDQGEDFNPATSVGKTITFNGRLQAGHGQTRLSLEDWASDWLAAWTDRSSIQTFLVAPWWDTKQFIFKGRVLTNDGDETQERDWNAVPSPWQFPFSANVRMKDGRFYWWNESGTPGDFMSWTNASSVNVTNSGNAPTDPIITVAGVTAGQDVHLIRDGSLDLWFRGLPAGDLIVDFSVRRAYMDLITDVTDTYDELSSDWWDAWQVGVPAGAHTIAKGPGAGTSIKVDMFSAWI